LAPRRQTRTNGLYLFQETALAQLQSDIEAANRAFMGAVKRSDVDEFIQLYTEDAVLLLPGREPLEGREGARTFFASFQARGVREIRLTTIEVEGTGDTAWERGSSESVGADGIVIGRGKYIVIWKRLAGDWKLYRDILNASA
jgi:ketosteroid isomerase-like protein